MTASFGWTQGVDGSAPCFAQRPRVVRPTRLGARGRSGAGEFYLIEQNKDSDYPLRPPVELRPAEPGRQSYSIAAVNEFDPLFDDIYQFCEDRTSRSTRSFMRMGRHRWRSTDPRLSADLADQAFLFKRTARKPHCATRSMPLSWRSPMQRNRSAMHIHQSVVDTKTRKNIFSNADGTPSQLFSRISPAAEIHAAPWVCSAPTSIHIDA